MCYWKPFADETLQALCMFEQWVSNPAFEDVLSSFIPPTSLLPVGTISHRRDKCQKALFNILRMQMTAKYSSSEWITTIWKLICCLGSCGVCLFEQLINPAIRYVICDFRYHSMSRCCSCFFFFFFRLMHYSKIMKNVKLTWLFYSLSHYIIIMRYLVKYIVILDFVCQS